ncbi:hypothetical protein D0962_29790 [Leptolyngbyaceae cyanobacterium CCMR0082]|uniref:Uncharacterized protein n=1 Tax=Adonisia turfae CCMR0082 TaxID=2304604 RepID=A0A6M0SEI7_9CYAN|nr:hypothetical protein [Adonisia turfae]MDV3348724.1 hypothetical protein [Leptothoe sp. LEGE 181152]NEZ66899.1 hypothetical protein [Adonisia turfae CCMR0082]
MASILKNVFASVIGLGLVLGFATVPALAQSNGGFEDLSGDSDNNEVFGGSGVSLTDLLSNARRADGLSQGEFSQKTDRDIDEAAADFRQRQQEAIGTQQGGVVGTPELEEQL